ncbi:SDR family oxidoreductase [Enterobacteriaceae endosymbiont of Plateumaris pusilla]|uniref:enoyl-ACP reductase FabI n=1 Tax=Enterobacteriaceae endosymbiont of Plateumaris pusilla TaxID=2675795 RepID=UPI0014491F14|nr:enoyl-ACP reductase [Enterobacteriaceae endosymbiont of Plateumaris pusilla]QJC29384.1 SDR family oxidoreductase [Enterobacteriaceae endosymbiont of Plateumaris pusilla]
MKLLLGKKILITGIISKLSIAYGIAKAMYNNKAELIFTYHKEKNKKRVEKLVKNMTNYPIIKCNVSKDNNIKSLFIKLSQFWSKFHGFIHSIAFVPKNQLKGSFIDNTSRKGFQIAHDISSYSLTAMVKECRNMLYPQSAIVSLSYLGSNRVVPNYNVMGLAKASLEANIRYIAYDIGKQNIRINGISSSPIKTLSSSGINNLNNIIKYYNNMTPLSYTITINDIGNVAVFLCSDLSCGITGEIIHVDGGFNLITMNENLKF